MYRETDLLRVYFDQEVFYMQRRKVVHEALKAYARTQIRHPRNTLTPVQWVDLLNCYAGHISSSACAEKVGITPAQAEMWYCHFSLAVTSYALALMRRKYQA